MDDEEHRTGGRGRTPVVVAVGAVAVLVAGVVVFAFRGSDDGGETVGVVPEDVLSGTGTELPGGLTVDHGSSLLVPVVPGDERSTALVLVEGDPAAVWTAYAQQTAEQFPDEGIDPSLLPGCELSIRPTEPVCTLQADTRESEFKRRALSLSMRSMPGDVTGRFLLLITSTTYTEPPLLDDQWEGGGEAWSAGELPQPQPARARPDVGEPLAPETVAYEGDNERYVLLEGSELIAQYGQGGITGGFAVWLRTTPGNDANAVASAYAEQAVQWEGEPVPPPDVQEYDGTTLTTYHPPGGAGGYSGTVTAVDQPGDDDFIRYVLIND